MKKTAKELAEALGRGKETRQSDRSYTTLCPAHDDNSPSLSITETTQGKMLFKCHTGCAQDAVMKALKDLGLWEGGGKTWKVLNKAPESAREPNGMVHFKFGVPSKRWEYRNRRGELVGYIYRFDRENGGKELVPLAWCVAEEDGATSWRWKSFNKPRTLYNEHLLDKDKAKPILVVEGEKTADAAAALFHDYTVVTWPGGSNAIRFVQWEVLKNRDVTIWPDADPPGLKCASTLAEILVSVGAKSVKLVFPPADLPEGWDLADEVPEGVELDRRALVITAREFTPSGDARIDEFNSKMALTLLGDKAVIIWERWNNERKKNVPSYMSIQGIKAYYSNEFVNTGRKEIPIVDYWMQHPSRRSYHSVVFEPGVDVPGAYNLWRGFTYTPDPTGDWSLFEEHLRLNVTKGDESLYNWLVAWFAQMIQQPRAKPGTSIGIQGKQGSGKTVVGHHMGALIRDNYVLVDDPRYVTGQFNSHMGNALLLQADEGFFAGDVAHIGRLKGLVTSSTNRIEPKGKDSFEINNYLRLLITSNSSHLIQAAFEERRFAILDCGNGRLQDRPFFLAMQRQMDNGGYEGLLHHLLNLDLSTIDVGDIPKTEALGDQKRQSLGPAERFWFERLRDGETYINGNKWERQVQTERFYQTYIKRCQDWGVMRRSNNIQFGKDIKRLMPDQVLKRVRISTESNDEYGQRSTRLVWGYAIDDLKACRKAFEDLMGTTIDWENDDEETLSAMREAIKAEASNEEIPF